MHSGMVNVIWVAHTTQLLKRLYVADACILLLNCCSTTWCRHRLSTPAATADHWLLLQGFKTLLTDSEDASFLFNCIVDGIVDHAMPLCQVYASRIAALEGIVLQQPRPKAEYTKELHLLSNDLNGNTLHNTLKPSLTKAVYQAIPYYEGCHCRVLGALKQPSDMYLWSHLLFGGA